MRFHQGQPNSLAKQYLLLGGEMVLIHSLRSLVTCDRLVLVANPPTKAIRQEIESKFPTLIWADPGPRRQDSVRAGLEKLQGLPADERPDFVLIHDGARPLLSRDLLSRLIAGLEGGAIAVAPALALTDALKLASRQDGVLKMVEDRDRRGLYQVQTPQGFHYPLIAKAHNQALSLSQGQANGPGFDDDIGLIQAGGGEVQLVEGERTNLKITYPADLDLAETWLANQLSYQQSLERVTPMPANPLNPRIGHGYDIHGFTAHQDGAKPVLRLGGVAIPYPQRLKGHSDADCLLHAITDALLGAMGAGDIGEHFPPDEEQWHNADSVIFLRHALDLLKAGNGKILNLDTNIHCEKPKLRPWKSAIIAKLAEILELKPSQISVKARTNEGFDAIGQQQALAASATILIDFPNP